MFNAAVGVNLTHIPYRGGAPAMQDLIAGRIDYQCPIMPTVLPQIEGFMSDTQKSISEITVDCRIGRRGGS